MYRRLCCHRIVRLLCAGFAIAHRQRATGTAFLIGALLAGPRTAHAQRGPTEIAYDAEPTCPTASDVIGMVRERAERVDVVPSSSPFAPVQIHLHAQGDAFS